MTTPKNGKTREIPLGDDVLASLKRHRHLRGEVVFCKADGSMFTKGESKHPLWRACKRAGLRRIGWHVLRHTYSHLVMRKAPIKAVQELLGHSTITMTERYAHLSPDVRKDAVRLLDHVHTTSIGGGELGGKKREKSWRRRESNTGRAGTAKCSRRLGVRESAWSSDGFAMWP